jgi:Immunity protein 45
MDWVKLSDTKDIAFFAGSIFRFPAAYPYEKFVDYMLVLDGSVAKAELKFVVTTGSKAGLINILCSFPKEAYIPGSLAISSEWLQQNWSEWVYNDCDMKDVFVSNRYPPPSSLP